jgi:hypothetical protein
LKIAAFGLAAVFFVIAVLYLVGVLQLGTHGPPGKHHVSHFVLFAVLAALCLVWARFQKNATPAR